MFLKEGDIIELKKGMGVYAKLPYCYMLSFRDAKPGDFSLHDVEIEIGKNGTEWMAGEYLVYKTAMEGGGGGHNDTYPDGHCVYCFNVRNEEFKVSFYQSGSFSTMIQNISPIAKAKLKWSR